MRKLNYETLIRIFILTAFTFFFLNLISSGDITNYVHPRIIPFVIIATIAMLGITILLITDILRKKRVKRKFKSYGIFIIPIVLAFSMGNMKINFKSEEVKIEEDITIGNKDNSNKEQEEIFKINDDEYMKFLNEYKDNFDLYKDKKIEIVGFVTRNESTSLNEFEVGRFIMTCCIADMTKVGILCRSISSEIYENDTWVKVIGTLEKNVDKGIETVILRIHDIEKINTPQNQYIYPY